MDCRSMSRSAPAWDPTDQFIAFNGFYNGTRHVFVADMRDVIKKVRKYDVCNDRERSGFYEFALCDWC